MTLDWQNHIASTIVEAEKSFPSKHLIAQNIANGSKVIDDPNPNVSIFNFHYAYPPNAVQQNYHLNKVIGYDETGFHGDSDAKYRGDAWAFLLAGGGLYDNLDYSFTVECEDGTASQDAPGGGSPSLRHQLQILKNYLYSFDFVKMVPNSSIISSIHSKTNTKGWALVEEGKAYAIYLRNHKNSYPRKAEIELNIPKGNYSIEWLNPVSGTIDKEAILVHSGDLVKLVSPDFLDDVALRIKKSED